MFKLFCWLLTPYLRTKLCLNSYCTTVAWCAFWTQLYQHPEYLIPPVLTVNLLFFFIDNLLMKMMASLATVIIDTIRVPSIVFPTPTSGTLNGQVRFILCKWTRFFLPTRVTSSSNELYYLSCSEDHLLRYEWTDINRYVFRLWEGVEEAKASDGEHGNISGLRSI